MTHRSNICNPASGTDPSGQTCPSNSSTFEREVKHLPEHYGEAPLDGMDRTAGYDFSSFPPAFFEEGLPPSLLDSESNLSCSVRKGSGAGRFDGAPDELNIDPRIQAGIDLLSSSLDAPESWSVLDLMNEGPQAATPAESWLCDEIGPDGNHIVTAPSNGSTYPQGAEMQTAKRRAHYCIEKRYRANLNDKIRALDDILPKASTSEKAWTDQGLQDQGSGADENGYPMKRSKGEVLSRTIKYIVFLQRKVSLQEKEIGQLKSRMHASRKALELGCL